MLSQESEFEEQGQLAQLVKNYISLATLNQVHQLYASHSLEQLEELFHKASGERKALLAWTIVDRKPTHLEGKRYLKEEVTYFEGTLYDGVSVVIRSEALVCGGSWLKENTNLIAPQAWDSPVLQEFSLLLDRFGVETFVDVGANTGSFALLPIQRNNLHCIAFEPNPKIAELLRSHVEQNRLSEQVTIHEQAVSSTEGILELAIPRQTGLATLGSRSHLVDYNIVEVPVVTLDSALAGFPPVGALKIDTEGHELPILEGARETLERQRPIVLLEAVDIMMDRHGYDRSALVSLLKSHRYTLKPIGTEDLIAIPEEAE